ncbi:MAG: low-specificity L-threonine aldolase, partial [Rhodoferax sp.]|nr:low-specificity L-threonine aldolase [Rhodoferax sp.]
VETPDTNIVFVDLVGGARERADQLIPFLKARGVLASGLYRLRFVTHLDVDAAGVQRAADAMAAFCAD